MDGPDHGLAEAGQDASHWPPPPADRGGPGWAGNTGAIPSLAAPLASFSLGLGDAAQGAVEIGTIHFRRQLRMANSTVIHRFVHKML